MHSSPGLQRIGSEFDLHKNLRKGHSNSQRFQLDLGAQSGSLLRRIRKTLLTTSYGSVWISFQMPDKMHKS